MCKICIDWEKGKMTSQEAINAIGEMIGTGDEKPQHYVDLASKIMDKEVSSGSDQDAELDEEWERKKGGD